MFSLLPIAHCVFSSGHATLLRPVGYVRRRVLTPISHLCVCPGKHLSHFPCHVPWYFVPRRMPSSPDRGPASTLYQRENAAMLSVMGLS